MNNYINVLKKYAVFTGRARRKEYWMFTLVNLIILLVLDVITQLLIPKTEVLAFIFSTILLIYDLALIVPSIAVAVRRLHDTNRSGWWFFIVLIPFVGAIILIVFMCLDSTPGDNRFGVNPKSAPMQSPQA